MPRIEPFEKYTTRYEDWFTKHKFAYESELRAIREYLPESKNSLEVGVGSGRFAAPLEIKLGLEPSAKMGEIARRRGIEIVAGIAEALPFLDSSFDLLLMVTTICFVDNLELAFEEAYRVLRANGCLILGFIDRASPLGKLYEKHKANNVFYRDATFYSVREVIPLLEKRGFRDLKFGQTIFKNLSDIDRVEPVKPGYGEGSFIVIKAMK